MKKLWGWLIVAALFGLVCYLYTQVTSLQDENKQLKARIGHLAALETENAHLRQKLAQRESKPTAVPEATQDQSLIEAARAHILNAEDAVAKGQFARAVSESQSANVALTKAADQASSQSRGTVQALRSRLTDAQTKARSIWKQFGG